MPKEVSAIVAWTSGNQPSNAANEIADLFDTASAPTDDHYCYLPSYVFSGQHCAPIRGQAGRLPQKSGGRKSRTILQRKQRSYVTKTVLSGTSSDC
jgi:hypothetical protein